MQKQGSIMRKIIILMIVLFSGTMVALPDLTYHDLDWIERMKRSTNEPYTQKSIISTKFLFEVLFSLSKNVLIRSNLKNFIGFMRSSHKILLLIFLNIYSNTATKRAPDNRKNNVPWRPNAIYLLKMWIIKIGLNKPIIVIKKVNKRIVFRELLSFNMWNQNFIIFFYNITLLHLK